MRLEGGVRKFTSLPAERENLKDCGLLKPGFYADITIFNPATLKDIATYAMPAQRSSRVKYVLVNGRLEYEHGRLAGAKAGRIVRGPALKMIII